MSSIRIHQFYGRIQDKNVHFQAIRLRDQLVLWIGLEGEPTFNDLSLAMKTNYEKFPTSVKILGDTSTLTSSNLASRLSKRCQKPVFVSFNIPESSQEMFMKIEEKLIEEITVTPECF